MPARRLKLKLVPADDQWEARVKGPSFTPGYWNNEELTRAAFDEEGFYRLGDALRFADPDDPSRGFFFDRRVAENIKMATGTWVGVAALRSTLIDILQGLAQDAIIAGESRRELAALIVPFRPAFEQVDSGDSNMSDEVLFASPRVRDRIATLLTRHNDSAGGSSERVTRAMILTEPLDLDRGEVTDKGSVNQQVIFRTRAELVNALYSDDPRVICSYRN